MSTFAARIAYYLERFREGDTENAFHSLIELDHESIPNLMAEFQAAADPELKAFLFHVILQHLRPSVIPRLVKSVFSGDRDLA